MGKNIQIIILLHKKNFNNYFFYLFILFLLKRIYMN